MQVRERGNVRRLIEDGRGVRTSSTARNHKRATRPRAMRDVQSVVVDLHSPGALDGSHESPPRSTAVRFDSPRPFLDKLPGRMGTGEESIEHLRAESQKRRGPLVHGPSSTDASFVAPPFVKRASLPKGAKHIAPNPRLAWRAVVESVSWTSGPSHAGWGTWWAATRGIPPTV